MQDVIAATCGNLYRPLIGKVTRVPDPGDPAAARRTAVCSSRSDATGAAGASARRGAATASSGVDPSLPAVRAARRVAERLGVEAEYVVADARRLPFADASFDVVFSYSVFQHFTKPDAVASFSEIGRVLRPGGISLVQMANVWGARSLWNQLRERRFREPRTLFDVRYWGPRELEQAFARSVGRSSLAVDGYLTLNPQPADLDLLPRRYRALVQTSEALRRLSARVPLLTYAADSLYVSSRR